MSSRQLGTRVPNSWQTRAALRAWAPWAWCPLLPSRGGGADRLWAYVADLNFNSLHFIVFFVNIIIIYVTIIWYKYITITFYIFYCKKLFLALTKEYLVCCARSEVISVQTYILTIYFIFRGNNWLGRRKSIKKFKFTVT